MEQPKEQIDLGRRQFIKDVVKAASAVAAASAVGKVGGEVLGELAAREVEKERRISEIHERIIQKEIRDIFEEAGEHPYYDHNPEFLAVLTEKNGEWSKEQRAERTEVLKNGERVFRDVGMTFYEVHKRDVFLAVNPKKRICKRLSQYAEFSHVRADRDKLFSFNIKQKDVKEGMWLPVPSREQDRNLSEAQFVLYASRAIDEMKTHPEYGDEVAAMIEKVGERGLIAQIIAVAKQEGGDNPIGEFVLHRWEQAYEAFSLSVFHVLMVGAGLRARQKLNLTEGQTYHPQNAVKLFLAFMVEKAPQFKKTAADFFPLTEHAESFAELYNGRKWYEFNPNYASNISDFEREADEHLGPDGKCWSKESITQ